MPKIFIKNKRAKSRKKYTSWWRFGGKIVALMLGIFAVLGFNSPGVSAASKNVDCHDLMVVFARGSGAEKDTNDNYLDFRNQIENIIKNTGVDRAYYDLDYEAKGIGVDNIWTLVGAFFGAGDAYDFGASVDEGVSKLTEITRACPDSKFVLGGYSQGAMVVSQAIHSIDASKVIYAATFGDPKIYLPEGKAWGSLSLLNGFTGTDKNLLRTGVIPAACKGENLSDYRMYVPDCYAYEGMLGSYRPYEPLGYSGKLGTWCNKYDMFCSSYLSASSHTSYVSDGLYLDAAKVIAGKVAETFNAELNFISKHDTAILIDSTASMDKLIDSYKAEALNLARETLKNGGRVALFDYRDVSERYQVKERCNFETCTLEKFETELDEIETDGGGDTPESLLSSSLAVMKKLNWNFGSTKSIVVLTDAGYHSPDGDGVTFDEVIKLSKEIDPVNFYIITPEVWTHEYESLALATDGAVVNSATDLSILTRKIMKRSDSLPVVEEDSEFDADVPVVEVTKISSNDSVASVEFLNSGDKVLVSLNDAVLGVTDEDYVIISGLNPEVENILKLTPLSENRRGETVEVNLALGRGDLTVTGAEIKYGNPEILIIPKVPDTGKAI